MSIPSLLQAALVDLIALDLYAHQAHWNVRGATFRTAHQAFEELYTSLDTMIDEVAERIATLGTPPSGQPEDIAKTTVSPLPAGFLNVPDAIDQVAERLEQVAETNRLRLKQAEEDLVTQDLLIGVVGSLEKQLWMLRSTRG